VYPYDDWYIGVFGVANYESIVTFAKFKMADPIWLTNWRKFQNLRKKFSCILC